MTDREEFKKFWESQGLYPDWATTVWKAWQARGELDAVRIKELKDRLNSIAIDWQVKERECITLRNDKATLEIQVQTLREVLDRLARLGNEPLLGNSDGNKIAWLALKELDK